MYNPLLVEITGMAQTVKSEDSLEQLSATKLQSSSQPCSSGHLYYGATLTAYVAMSRLFLKICIWKLEMAQRLRVLLDALPVAPYSLSRIHKAAHNYL